MSKLFALSGLGQSIWFDYIQRNLILSGELDDLISKGVKGITSNPSIFEKAIAGSNDYNDDILSLIEHCTDTYYVYEKLVLKDISLAAEKMSRVFEDTKGIDGYVSIEVEPTLADDTEGTIEQAKKLYNELNRPNIMIKVPATKAGIPAIKELISCGINVNVTLIFGKNNYKEVAKAYIEGLKILKAKGGDLSRVASVASFFVSRVDTAIDKLLDKLGNTELKGKAAIANSKVSYKLYEEIYSSEDWKELKSCGAKEQRLLWASTGTKNPLYSDTMYVDGLIGFNTVNTIPPATLNAYLDHGIVEETLYKDMAKAEKDLEEISKLGIDISNVTDILQIEGVKAFVDSYKSLLTTLEKKIFEFRFKGSVKIHINGYNQLIPELKEKINSENLVERLFKKDYTIWSDNPTELANRLDWFDSPVYLAEHFEVIEKFALEIKEEGFKKVILLGMGGSSLAPEVFRKIFGIREGYPDLEIVDNTHPEFIQNLTDRISIKETLFIVSTKSGGTVETFSFMKFFYRLAVKELGEESVGRHFVAITDPNSGLEKVAKELKFRKIFLNNPNIGGRYSVLSMFGIVPAALLGIDIRILIQRAWKLREVLKTDCSHPAHPITLGMALGRFADKGKDKFTFLISKEFFSLGSWIEQLVAESSGKNGKGILPVIEETIDNLKGLSRDRIIIVMRTKDDEVIATKKEELIKDGYDVIEFNLCDKYALGAQFFLWEILTIFACKEMSVQPFDQPDVESAKISARKFVQLYKESGTLPLITTVLSKDGVGVVSDKSGNSFSEIFEEFLRGSKKDAGYISIQAYLPYSSEYDEKLIEFKNRLMEKTGMPVTIGYGPRFLHSTGQLHKGDSGNGFFIQLVKEANKDIEIPDEANEDKSSLTFGVLIKAQALGDWEALKENNKRVISFVFNDNFNFIDELI